MGKESTTDNRKIEGIQIFTKAQLVTLESPTLKVDKFKLNIRIEEWGVSLITISRTTNLIEDCT